MPDRTSIAKPDGAPSVPSGDDAREPSLDRITAETKSLTEDVTEWLRLKIQLIQIEVHERVTEEINALLSSVLVLGLFLVAVLLIMMALGLYLGQWLENDALGFLIASILVVLMAVILGRTEPQWIGTAMYFLVPRRWLKAILRKNDKPRED